ncbi:hypothetical protein OBBRIDRAFT_739125 [Obba rivulosa]|uniref:Aminoglycoside phosphotransferase domain-containing protein n=1 Tax=Obba rivulosa TaxID=1052685 RepID=A0A8E2AV07_9APHY|nr:hypothetical protein OBBRIDRAFT_739125 [Obba rivulosa]
MVPAVTDDKWSRGPFNLSHADLAPPNILVEPSGPNAGTISAVVDWEMASTAPLWELICYPDWFEKEVPWCDRDEATARAFMGTYVDEMRRLGHSEELLGLIEQGGWRRRFTEIALQPWLAIDLMENWLKSNNR